MLSKKAGVFLALIAILILINFSLYQKERHLAHGTVVCLRLAPVDPRSLMQGDYMRLRFALADTLRKDLAEGGFADNTDGRILLHVERNCTATYVTPFIGQKLRPGKIILRYRQRNRHVKIATNAFFFQEGTGQYYAKARYGVFRVNADGEPLLTGLKDAHLRTLNPSDPKE